MRRTIHSWLVLSVLMLANAAAAQSQTTQPVDAKPIDYETFCKLPDEDTRRRAFVATTAENKGLLVRTQIERWRDANRASLTTEQSAVLAELLTSITADMYSAGPKGEDARTKAQQVHLKVGRLFTADQLAAMQPSAPCIAPLLAPNAPGGVPGGIPGGVVSGLPVAPVRPGGDIRVPVKIKDVPPIYPPVAQQARLQGAVVIEAIIGTDGRVREATVTKGVPLLNQAALDAVLQWEYRPTLLAGQPVAVVMTITVTFALKGPIPGA